MNTGGWVPGHSDEHGRRVCPHGADLGESEAGGRVSEETNETFPDGERSRGKRR